MLAYGSTAPAIPEDEFIGRVAAQFVAAIFFRTLAFYALAAVAGWIARAAGGRGDWRDSRAALFWAALVAAPVILAATLLSILLTGLPGQLAPAARMVGALAFAWTTAHCFAEAHGFKNVWRVLAVVTVFAGLFVAGLLALMNL